MRHNVRLNTHEYRAIRDCAPDRKARLAVRLCGEAGMNIVELTDLRLNRVTPVGYPDGLYWLHIPELDGGGGRMRPRDALITESLVELFRRIALDVGGGFDKPVFDVTKRTIQNWVKKSAEEAAHRVGPGELAHVSSADLKDYWVRYCVETLRINPMVVMELGGWRNPEVFVEYLTKPDERMIAYEYSRYGAKSAPGGDDGDV
jgi:hypothetical protein